MDQSYGKRFRETIDREEITPLIGVYDVFSASIAARHYDALFVSGFSFAASFYGLPDIGFIAWSDMTSFVQRIRTVLPAHHLLVDIDDGYTDAEVACHVVSLLEGIGASGVVLEDQERPRRCGHFVGKKIMELDRFLEKLGRVLEARSDLFVVARTDVSEEDEALRRAEAFSGAGADAVLVDAVKSLNMIERIHKRVKKPIVYSQLDGGKSPLCGLSELSRQGVSMVIYSTPCLFAAQAGVEEAMNGMKEHDGLLQSPRSATLGSCMELLYSNIEKRKAAPRTEG